MKPGDAIYPAAAAIIHRGPSSDEGIVAVAARNPIHLIEQKTEEKEIVVRKKAVAGRPVSIFSRLQPVVYVTPPYGSDFKASIGFRLFTLTFYSIDPKTYIHTEAVPANS